MERALYQVRILPGTEAEFDRRHQEPWPELAEELREAGVRNMSGFRRGTDAWFYLEAHPDLGTAFDPACPRAVRDRWAHSLRDVVAESTTPDGGPLWLRQVFHSGGDPLPGPMRRGLFSLVIDPERAADYDALHADPWPDMMAAIHDAGYRNYSGFRRGALVVYYGEYYPDMVTVVDRIGRSEVSARWGRAFEGVITSIRDADGDLFTADEVFHLD